MATSQQIREAVVDLNQELRLKSEAETRIDYLLDAGAVEDQQSTAANRSLGHKLTKKDLDQQAESLPPLQLNDLPQDLMSDKDHNPHGDAVESSPAKDAGQALSTPQPLAPPAEDYLTK